MRPVTIQMLQGTTLDLVSTPTVNQGLLESIDSAVFVVYKKDTEVLNKTLFSGISFNAGEITVYIAPEDTLTLSGSYKYELLVEIESKKYFVSYGIFDVITTKARIV